MALSLRIAKRPGSFAPAVPPADGLSAKSHLTDSFVNTVSICNRWNGAIDARTGNFQRVIANATRWQSLN